MNVFGRAVQLSLLFALTCQVQARIGDIHTDAEATPAGPVRLIFDNSIQDAIDALLEAGHSFVVSVEGNDDNPGTLQDPWRSLARAVREAGPGDTVFVRRGTYEAPVFLTRSGEPGRPIVFRNFPGETPLITGRGESRFGIVLDGVRLVHVRGFEVREIRTPHPRAPEVLHEQGAILLRESSDCVVEGNRIVPGGLPDYTEEDPGASGIQLWSRDPEKGCHRNLIRGNRISRAGYAVHVRGPAQYNVFEGNSWRENQEMRAHSDGIKFESIDLNLNHPRGKVQSYRELADDSWAFHAPRYNVIRYNIAEDNSDDGIVVILTAFYQRQHWHERALAGREALLNAVENMARWVEDRGYTNVVLEISNEYSHGGFRHWNDGEWLRSPEGQVELIRHARAAAPRLLVSTSDGGHGRMHEMIAEVADFILIHFNNTGLEDTPERIETVRTYGKPVVCNEDDKIEDVGAEALRLSVRHGAAWGLMLSRKNQYAPFEYDGAADDPVIYAMMKRLTTPGVSMDAVAPAKLSVVVTQPSDGLVFRAGGTLTMRASVFGTELDSVREVRFLADGEAIGGARGVPWSTTWENLSVGSYNLTAVAFGADGEELGRSRPVDIQVIPGD